MSDTAAPPMSADQVKYQRLIDAAAVASSRGMSGVASALNRRVNRFGTHHPDFDTSGTTALDLSSPDFSLTRGQATRGPINRVLANKGRGADSVRPSSFNTWLAEKQKEGQVTQGQDFYNTQIDPALKGGEETVSGMASTPLFGASYIQNARSSIASTIMSGAAQAQRRAGAILGLRGLDPSSPSGAALALRTALQADADLSEQFTQFGMDTETANRTAATQTAALGSQLATARLAARTAAYSGDRDALYSIQNNINSILEAIRVQKEQKAFENAQARKAGERDWVALAADVASSGMTAAATGGAFSGAAPMASTGGGLHTLGGTYGGRTYEPDYFR